MPIARIDGDLCTFAVASACEGKRYRYSGTVYDSKLELNKILKRDGVDDSAIEFFKEPESWEQTKTSAITYLEKVIAQVDMDYEIHLTGKSNFRYKVATILPYKGNRSGIERPVHLDGVRQLYVDLYDAKVSVNMEADDAIGLAHDPDSDDLIVTRDKDLNCIPGKHFNWDKDAYELISETEADRYFYKQVLTGDTTDNILGLYGVGKESKLLKALDNINSADMMFNYVEDQYEKRFGHHVNMFLSENCKLLWILQKRKPNWEKYFA